MKYILSFFLTFSVLCTLLSAVEYGGLSTNGLNGYPTYIELEKGDVLEILSCSSSSNGAAAPAYNKFMLFTKDADLDSQFSNASQIDGFLCGVTTSIVSENFDTFVGPLKVAVYRNADPADSGGYDFFAFYKLTRASEVEYKNVNIVALPTSTVGQGTHEIVVEASDDLQTWTPVHSSSIGGSKAFFRTRVVEAGD